MGTADDPTLDFLSEDFDALKAINTPGLQPPLPNIKPLDNLQKCRSILPPQLPESLANAQRPTANLDSKTKSAQFKERALLLAQRIEQSATASLEKVHQHVQPGPLQQLAKWHAQHSRVRVLTRHANGLRGIATGQLVAYDRFMNVVLRDAFEQYTVITKVPKTKTRVVMKPCKQVVDENPVEPGELGQVADVQETVTRWVRKQEARQRTLGLVFIKGDNIVVVSSCPEGELDGAAWKVGAGQCPRAASVSAGTGSKAKGS